MNLANTSSYELIRSARRTVSLEVNAKADLIIRAPHRLPEKYIHQLLTDKQNWIQQKQQEMKLRLATRPSKNFTNGEKYFYLGQHYPLQIEYHSDFRFRFHNDTFLMSAKDLVRPALVFEKWYRKQTRLIVTQKVAEMTQKTGSKWNTVRINGAKGRWGSCSARGNLNFSWRLIMAPEHIVDYVVAHEVAHLKQMNHSQAFWHEVAKLYPDYQNARKWLKNQGHQLVL